MKLPTDVSLAELQQAIIRELSPAVPDAHISILVLLAFVLKAPKTWVLAQPEACLNAQQAAVFAQLVQRFAQGEPLAYLTGSQEFYGLNFRVSPAVLIPRPETELLIDEALAWLSRRYGPVQALDVGTGSGCIAITLAKKAPHLQLTATDISAEALAIAATNAREHQVCERITFLRENLIPESLSGFDLICANLPYIPSSALNAVNSIAYEPKIALDGGLDGLRLLRRFFEQVPRHLNPHGLVLAETEAGLGAETIALARENLPNAHIELLKDLSDHDRLVRVQLD